MKWRRKIVDIKRDGVGSGRDREGERERGRKNIRKWWEEKMGKRTSVQEISS